MISLFRGLFRSINPSLTNALLIFLIPAVLSLCLVQNSLIPQSHLAKGSAGPSTTEFVSYKGSKYGINIQYPKSWNITEHSSTVSFVSPVDRTGNIMISIQPAGNASLSERVQALLLESKSSYHWFKINSSKMTTMAGIPANRTDYQIKDVVPRFLGDDIYEYGFMQISTIKGARLYTFTYFSTTQNFNLFLPIAEKMLSTLKII
jgi:hypothetical protein